MIIVDHSLWGTSKLNGMTVGVYSSKTDELLHYDLPIDYFIEKNFFKQVYSLRTLEIVQDFFEKLGVKRNDSIYVGMRPALEQIHTWLDDRGYRWYDFSKGSERYSQLFEDFHIRLNNLPNPKIITQFDNLTWGFMPNRPNGNEVLLVERVNAKTAIRSQWTDKVTLHFGWKIENYVTCKGETLIALWRSTVGIPFLIDHLVAIGHSQCAVDTEAVLLDLFHLLDQTERVQLREQLGITAQDLSTDTVRLLLSL